MGAPYAPLPYNPLDKINLGKSVADALIERPINLLPSTATVSDDEAAPTNTPAFRDPAFTENRDQPVHRWIPWIAGFSCGFVNDCFDRYLGNCQGEPPTIVDPFSGVGTTLVEAARRGYNAVGFEVNPYPALATRAKLEAVDIDVELLEFWVEAFRSAVCAAVSRRAIPPMAVPPGFRSRIAFFSPDIERQVLLSLTFIRGLADQSIRDMFLVALGSVMVKFSNYSYEPSLGSRPASGKPLIYDADVPGIIISKLREIVSDCRSFQSAAHREPRVRQIIADSFFNAGHYLEPNTTDLIVTSPPYLNNYHYIRNTRPHLFWLNLVTDTGDLKTIEHASFGKYWQTVRDGNILELSFDLPALSEVIGIIRGLNNEKGVYGGSGWANYAVQYFNDTYRFCAEVGRILKPGACAVVVVGNSIIQGVEIKVDEFLGRIGEIHGLAFEANHMLRTKRVGNSIIRSSVRQTAEKTASLYEVAVVLRKPN